MSRATTLRKLRFRITCCFLLVSATPVSAHVITASDPPIFLNVRKHKSAQLLYIPLTQTHARMPAGSNNSQHGPILIIRCPDFDKDDFTITLLPYGPYTTGDIKALVAHKILERGGPKYPVSALTLCTPGTMTPVHNDALNGDRLANNALGNPTFVVTGRSRCMCNCFPFFLAHKSCQSVRGNGLRTTLETRKSWQRHVSALRHCLPRWVHSAPGKRTGVNQKKNNYQLGMPPQQETQRLLY